ncbi:hypothetical protein [Streptomyces sp. NPDC007346]|uniref:hypothetical protein n=1 Tax=Streptomyces sp. NPDC007346 TaxID=3154682 RepID=UPI003457297D
MSGDPAHVTRGWRCDRALDELLAASNQALALAVQDRLSAQGGAPELRDPDVTLGRMLATAHRGLGASVFRRLTHLGSPEREQSSTEYLGPFPPHGHPLADRLAPVRIKYRSDALQAAQSYGLEELMPALAGARSITETVISLLEFEEADTQVHASVQQLGHLLEQAGRLTERPPTDTAAPPSSDYLVAVEESLQTHAAPLQRAVHDARQLLREELVPMFAAFDSNMDAEMVTRDLADDIEQAWSKAHDLSRAVAMVQKVSNDFVGEDLRQARLEGTFLTGVRWNASTTWPEEWEPLIRRASTPLEAEPGVLVIAAEPSNTMVSADS